MPWIRSSIKERLPRNAIIGGRTKQGNTIYVGRAWHNDEMLPCSVIPGQKAAYVPAEGEAVFKENYEVLCGDVYMWDRGQEGEIPAGALIGGRTVGGETLFIGRIAYNGALLMGKVQPSKRKLLVPYENGIQGFAIYDVLVVARCEGCGCCRIS